MQGDAINLKLTKFIKQCSGLITWSFEILYSAYLHRCISFQPTNDKIL